ncbi:MAG: DUF1003 domain-containing protein, partial [Nanoarchaeota archaeon]|nr:DUF1003 domain-containing protein [Nanoarchaeota archaeon]
MIKKKVVKNKVNKKNNFNGFHVVNEQLSPTSLTLGQRCSDWVASKVGSWGFIIFFLVFMAIWIWLNVKAVIGKWDPYPFILLNFVLSCLAAMQAPIILMSQNRQAER